MIQYELIKFFHREWYEECGKFDSLHEAIEWKTVLDTENEDAWVSFEILVKLP